MDIGSVQRKLSDVLVGASVLALSAAGTVLELHFSRVRLSNSRTAFISTDAWVVVNPEPQWDAAQIRDAEFFRSRSDALGPLFALTGFDVEGVHVSQGGVLELAIGGTRVVVCPVLDSSASAHIEQDFWVVGIEGEGGRVGYIGFDAREGFWGRDLIRVSE